MNKKYKIGKEEFNLKSYWNLTGLEEERANELLGIGRDGSVVKVELKTYELFTLILTPVNRKINIAEFDFRQMRNEQVPEIITDFLVEKKSSIDTMPVYLKNLIEKKMQQK